MDTKKCIVLLSVLDKLNITEAAKSLGYTPSGVSRIIESIEKEHPALALPVSALPECW